jgi:ribosome-associated protein
MLEVTELVRIPDEEIEWDFVRSSGPGGQNVNKVASKAVLRWRAITTSAAISARAIARMRAQFPSRFTANGDVLIQSQQYRVQQRNREDCLDKLAAMIRASLAEPLPRKPTKPTKGSQRRRVADKRRQSAKKRDRRSAGSDE